MVLQDVWESFVDRMVTDEPRTVVECRVQLGLPLGANQE
jgi:hypothetical protein